MVIGFLLLGELSAYLLVGTIEQHISTTAHVDHHVSHLETTDPHRNSYRIFMWLLDSFHIFIRESYCAVIP